MKAIEFVGQNLLLGPPKGWDQERAGSCGSLPVRREVVDGVPYVTSFWKPSAEDIAALAAGAHVMLSIVGINQPPVAVGVAKAEELP